MHPHKHRLSLRASTAAGQGQAHLSALHPAVLPWRTPSQNHSACLTCKYPRVQPKRENRGYSMTFFPELIGVLSMLAQVLWGPVLCLPRSRPLCNTRVTMGPWIFPSAGCFVPVALRLLLLTRVSHSCEELGGLEIWGTPDDLSSGLASLFTFILLPVVHAFCQTP